MRFIAMLLVFLFIGNVSVSAKDKIEGIVAVVNDDIITASDLFDRYALVASSSGLPNTPEVRNRFLPQILNALIDERLQLQEATKAGITVSEEDIQRGIAEIAQQNNSTPEQFVTMLQKRQLPTDSLKTQIKAQIGWQRFVSRNLRPQIEISQQDIDTETTMLLGHAGKSEYRVAEIFLPFDENTKSSEVQALAGKIVSQLAGGKAKFGALARQFSQNASASKGGSIGWVFEDQLPEDVAKELSKMKQGAVSRPIKTLTGYHIVQLQAKRVFQVPDERSVKVDVKQIFLPYGDRDEDDVTEEAAKVASEVGGCLSISEYYSNYDNDQTGDFGIISVADIAEELQNLARTLPIAQISEPIQTEEGVYLLMVCDRKAPPSSLPSEDDIANALGQERLNVLQRRHLRDLRATAFIERRV